MKGIIAVNNKNYIGLNGKLPWKSSEDLEHFKELTMGCKILVGYNTAQTLPKLEGRSVIIDQKNIKIDDKEIEWCCGGTKTYNKYCHLFRELHISIIDDDTIGDVLFPEMDRLDERCVIYYYKFKTD